MMLLACADPATLPAPTFVTLTADEERVVAPDAGAQTHPSLAHGPDGWLVAWDQDGASQRSDVRALGWDGAALGDTALLTQTGGGGFSTPDLTVAPDGGWYAVARVANQVIVFPGEWPTTVFDGGSAGTGDFGFWTAPDVAWSAGALAVGWWDGDLAPNAPASYVLTVLDPDLEERRAPFEVAHSDDTGSPMAIEPAPGGGWVLAWSADGAIQVARAGEDGAVADVVRVDDWEAEWPPSRPALAVADDGAVVVGWRAQDADQAGFGTRLRWLDADLDPLAPSIGTGLDPAHTNRVEVSVDGDTLAAVWEEATADGDVVVQLFSRGAREPRTGPVRVHDEVEGRQARPTVDVAEAPDGLSVGVTWESGPTDGDGAVHFRRFRVE